jgi:hypothetical protein
MTERPTLDALTQQRDREYLEQLLAHRTRALTRVIAERDEARAALAEPKGTNMGLPEHLESLKWELAYWEWCAKYGRRSRIWRSGFDRWAFRVYLGGDEFGRHTLVIGPWVIALWSCRCADCKAEERALQQIIDVEETD